MRLVCVCIFFVLMYIINIIITLFKANFNKIFYLIAPLTLFPDSLAKAVLQ